MNSDTVEYFVIHVSRFNWGIRRSNLIFRTAKFLGFQMRLALGKRRPKLFLSIMLTKNTGDGKLNKRWMKFRTTSREGNTDKQCGEEQSLSVSIVKPLRAISRGGCTVQESRIFQGNLSLLLNNSFFSFSAACTVSIPKQSTSLVANKYTHRTELRNLL